MKTFAPLCLHPSTIKPLHRQNATYKHPALQNIPNRPAVYVLKFSTGDFYVGSTKSLNTRLRNWCYKHPTALFNYSLVPEQNLRAVEDKVIKALKARGIPGKNIQNARSQKRPPRPVINPDSIRQQALRAGVNPGTAYGRLKAGKKITTRPRKPYKRWVTINGRTRPLSFWARWYKISMINVLARIHRSGWDEIRAVQTPVKKLKK